MYKTRPYLKNTFGLIPNTKVVYQIDSERTLNIKKLFGTPLTIPLDNISIDVNHGTSLKGFLRDLFDYGNVTIRSSSGEFTFKNIRDVSKFQLALDVKLNSMKEQLNQNQSYVSKITNRGVENFGYKNITTQFNLIDEITSEHYHFKIYDNGTIHDSKHNTSWIRAPWGMQWNGESFTGKPAYVNWDKASSLFGTGDLLEMNDTQVVRDYPKYFKDSSFNTNFKYGKVKIEFAGYSDWRLPTVEELSKLLFLEIATHGLYDDVRNDLLKKLFVGVDKSPESVGHHDFWAANSRVLKGIFNKTGYYSWMLSIDSGVMLDVPSEQKNYCLFIRKD